MSKESNNGDREKFASRLGFILVSAGCAIGLGNVWKFPYICGQNGGAIFIVIYLLCLLLLGYPILTCEFAIGRGSGKSVGSALKELAPKGGNLNLDLIAVDSGSRQHIRAYLYTICLIEYRELLM